jgi:hypothetical protein
VRFCLSLLLLLLLSSCGDLPEPFLGNPGANGRILAQPPTPRLAVPTPTNALLGDDASRKFASNIAAGLQAIEVPAIAGRVRSGDWRLVTDAETRGATVVPVFTIIDPKGKDMGKAEGAPVSTQAWALGADATLDTAAADAAPKISNLLTSIQTAELHRDPNSLYNRVAKVDVATVTGAPGDGNPSLTKQMKAHLSALGPVVQDTPNGADFVVQGDVKMVPIAGNQQRVEIQWSVKASSGDERGKVVQLNEIPAGSLDHYWADVAIIVATEAAGGVNDVILRQSGREPDKDGQPPGKPGEPGKTGEPGKAAAAAPVHGQTQGALLESPKAGVEPVR